MNILRVDCPNCKKKVTWNAQSEHRPFCSKRCQLIDLGEWAEEQKSIPCGGNKDAQIQQLPDIEDIEAMLSEQQDDFFKSD